jgi:predicted nucleic acid-binding protein
MLFPMLRRVFFLVVVALWSATKAIAGDTSSIPTQVNLADLEARDPKENQFPTVIPQFHRDVMVSVPSLPSIVLGEFRYGILGSKFHRRYEAWLQNSLKAFAVISVDGATTVHYAMIRYGLKSRGMPIPENDIWIAALALEYRLPVLSRDKHFSYIPEIRHLTW